MISKGETIIDSILGYNGLDYYREYKIKHNNGNYQYMDFYVKYKNRTYCIEYHGKQHYEYNSYFKNDNQKIMDYNKKRYCYLNNIQYVEIPYTKDTVESVYKELKKQFKDIEKPSKVKIYKKPKLILCDIELYKNETKLFVGSYSDILNKYSDITQTNMIKCLKGYADSTNGYSFCLLDEIKEKERLEQIIKRKNLFEITKYSRVSKNKIPITSMDIDTGKEVEFDSIKECEEYYNINGISMYLKDKGKTRKTISNKIFKITGGDYYTTREQAIKSRQNILIKATNISTGECITGGVNEIARIIGANAPNISKVLKGKSKTCKGFTFNYI